MTYQFQSDAFSKGRRLRLESTCPHCGRDLEGAELLEGECSSDDCPGGVAVEARAVVLLLRGMAVDPSHYARLVAALSRAGYKA